MESSGELLPLVWHTEQRRVNELVPYEKNPRLLTDKQKGDLTASLERFNLVEIPAINTDNNLIAGHQRCKIMILLGRGEEVIDVRVPNRLLTEGELKEYNIRSNANTGSWDLALLEENFDMKELSGWGLDFDKAVKQNKLFEVDIPAEMLDEDEPVPEVSSRVPLVKQGDVFRLGNHRIMCADSAVEDNVFQLLQTEEGFVIGDMVFTDPPYNVRIDSIVNLGRIQHKDFAMASGEMTAEEFTSFLKLVFNILVKYTRNGSIHFICMDWKHIQELIAAASPHYTEFKNLCIWVKDNGGMGSFYRSRHELVFVYKNGDAPHINNFELGQYGRYRTNVWEYTGSNSLGNPDKEESKLHPTVKPLKMVADALLDSSHIKGAVIDVFLGSGTTLIAAEQTKRRCFGLELDPHYIEVIIRRYVNYMKRLNQPVVYAHLNGQLSLESIIANV